MLGQCKLARQKLESAKAQGDKADPSLVEDLERKVAFLAEYEALPLRDKKKDAMLQSWSQDKSLKSWAEMHCNYTQDKGTESRDRSNYGTKYEVAATLKLDVKDPAQKRILDETLKDMDSDSDWDESNPLEMAMKKQKLRRYTWTKHEGTEHTMGSKESTSVVVSKDVTKHVAKAGLKMITEGASSATGTTPSVKIEHLFSNETSVSARLGNPNCAAEEPCAKHSLFSPSGHGGSVRARSSGTDETMHLDSKLDRWSMVRRTTGSPLDRWSMVRRTTGSPPPTREKPVPREDKVKHSLTYWVTAATSCYSVV
ncbi:unnamed protein product [Symbiodinium sp. CCMP2592]|nr:unnamed protein product [Symbiodinium sp. CCMP2592]